MNKPGAFNHARLAARLLRSTNCPSPTSDTAGYVIFVRVIAKHPSDANLDGHVAAVAADVAERVVVAETLREREPLAA
jgi:hypothetical protein